MNNIMTMEDPLDHLTPDELGMLLIEELAAKSPDLGYIADIIYAGCNIHYKDNSGLTLAYYAFIRDRNLKYLKLLVEFGVDVNMRITIGFESYDYNYTLLHAAIMHNNQHAIKYLLSIGAEIDVADYIGKVPLHWAAISKNIECIELLLKHGTNIRLNALRNMNPLHVAARYGNMRCMDILLQEGHDINSIDISGNTPLHYAAMSGIRDPIHMLLLNGANVNATSIFNNTPLHYAAMVNNIDGARELISNGSNVNVVNYTNRTALHYAVYGTAEFQCDMVRTLLDHGIDIRVKSDIGFTAWDFASPMLRDSIPELKP